MLYPVELPVHSREIVFLAINKGNAFEGWGGVAARHCLSGILNVEFGSMRVSLSNQSEPPVRPTQEMFKRLQTLSFYIRTGFL